MGINYLWDTNIAIYYLQQQLPAKGEAFIDSILTDSFPVISFITELELLCWKTVSENDIILLKDFIQDSLVIEIDTSIKSLAVDIRKSLKIKLPDAIIAATAEEHNLTLLTRNIKDFSGIKNLEVLNPFDL